MRILIFTVLFTWVQPALANNPIGPLAIETVMKTKPYIDKEHVRVWNTKQTDVIRINVIEFTGELPLHMHPDSAHNMLVVAGKVLVTMGKEKFEASRGSFIFIPQNIPHKYTTIGKSAILVAMDAPFYDREKTVYFD